MYSDGATDKGKRQPLLLGEREIAYLQTEAKRLIEDADAAEKNTERWRNEGKANLHARRAQCPLPGGLDALWSGRMVTADPSANIDTAVHVAHSWTVHSEEIDYDYWSVVDDRHAENGGQGAADHINESELGSGLFYGVRRRRPRHAAREPRRRRDDGGRARAQARATDRDDQPGSEAGRHRAVQLRRVDARRDGRRRADDEPRRGFGKSCVATRDAAQERMNAYLRRVDTLYKPKTKLMALSIEAIETTGAAVAESLDELAGFARATVKDKSA